jgi:Ca2+-binding RTX toxin-like protein
MVRRASGVVVWSAMEAAGRGLVVELRHSRRLESSHRRTVRRLFRAGVVVAAIGSVWLAVAAPAYATCREAATIVGTSGNDVLVGTAGHDVIWAGGGNDVVRGGSGNDTICGGTGADHLFGGPGRDVLAGGRNPDTLIGGRSGDRLFGGAERDWLQGGVGADRLVGGERGDQIIGGFGNDVLAGDGGADVFDLRAGGDDVADGGPGSDLFELGPGHDQVFGRGNEDSLVVSSVQANVDPLMIDLGAGTVTAGAVSRATLQGIEDAYATWPSDVTVVGTDARNRISVRAPSSTIDGLGGFDTLRGSDLGPDTINGGDDIDQIYGYASDDTLNGGAGSDYINGGPGADSIDGGPDRDLVDGGSDIDTCINAEETVNCP